MYSATNTLGLSSIFTRENIEQTPDLSQSLLVQEIATDEYALAISENVTSMELTQTICQLENTLSPHAQTIKLDVFIAEGVLPVIVNTLLQQISNTTWLQYLSLRGNGCNLIEKLPLGIGLAQNLETITIDNISFTRTVETKHSGTKSETSQQITLRVADFQVQQLKALLSGICVTTADRVTIIFSQVMRAEKLAILFAELSSIADLQHLEMVDANGHLTMLPDTLGDCTNLRALAIKKCVSLVNLPPAVSRLTHLTRFLVDHSAIDLSAILPSLPQIEEIHLFNLMHLTEFPALVEQKLKVLVLDNLPTLTTFSVQSDALTSVQRLKLTKLPQLNPIPLTIWQTLNGLQELVVDDTIQLPYADFPQHKPVKKITLIGHVGPTNLAALKARLPDTRIIVKESA